MRAQLARSCSALLVLLLSICFVPLADGLADSCEGGDPEVAAKVLIKEVEDLREVRDSTKMRAALDQLVQLHNESSSKSIRGALLQAAGKVLSDKSMGADREAAVEAIGRLNDPTGAYKRLKRTLPTRKTEEAGSLELAALRAVGALAPDLAIGLLVDLMTKGKDNNVAKEAVVVLGKFGQSKKRVRILEELVDYMQRAIPRRAPGKRVGAATRDRWSAVGSALVSALNRLTGQQVASAEDWIVLYKDMKRRPKELFLKER